MIPPCRPLHYSHRLTILLDDLPQYVPNRSETLQPMFSFHPFAHCLLDFLSLNDYTIKALKRTKQRLVLSRAARPDFSTMSLFLDIHTSRYQIKKC
jgi:hypothetical protein